MKRFSDFADTRQLEGDKIGINDVLNQEVIVHDFRVSESKYNVGDKFYMTLQVKFDNRKRVIFTSSGVLRSQLEKYKDELPFIAKIIRINNYYSLS